MKKINKIIVSLALATITMFTMSIVYNNIAHADPTFQYSGDGTAKQIYDDTGLTPEQLKKDHERSEEVANHYHGDIDTGSKHNNKKSLFYTSKDLKHIRHPKVKILKSLMEHKSINFKKNHKDRKVKRNNVFKISKAMKFNNVYRFKLSNHKYVTANKKFVKLIK